MFVPASVSNLGTAAGPATGRLYESKPTDIPTPCVGSNERLLKSVDGKKMPIHDGPKTVSCHVHVSSAAKLLL